MFPNLVAYHIYRGEPIPLADGRPYDYLLAGNGLFIRAETRFWHAAIPVAPCRVRGLPNLSTRFILKQPRLPNSLLYEVVRHAQQQRDRRGELQESLYRFRCEATRLRVVRPAQTASRSHVTTASDRPVETILELHSHGALPAFWSAADDRDEQGACIYGVIGRLDAQPELRLRLGLYGYWLPLTLADLFATDNLSFPLDDGSQPNLPAPTPAAPMVWPNLNPPAAKS